MRKELDEKLCEKYPLIFADRNAHMNQTCMCWGFECGDGWYNILDVLCASIQGHINNRLDSIKWAKKWNLQIEEAEANNWEDWEDWKARDKRSVPEPIEQVVAVQVKEKFGGLRFYFTGGDDSISAMVTMAEGLSYRTCEVCGAPSNTRTTDGWFRSRCAEHA